MSPLLAHDLSLSPLVIWDLVIGHFGAQRRCARVGSGVFSTRSGSGGTDQIRSRFSARVGSGVFSTRFEVQPGEGYMYHGFQCPCGLWGLFYKE
jgi:hypothetical protein